MLARLVARRLWRGNVGRMRKLIWAVLVAGCSMPENPCDNTVCPATHQCEARDGFGECVRLPEVTPTKDAGAGGGRMVDAGSVGGGSGGGAGGGSGGGGGSIPVDPKVFVTLSYDVPTCGVRPPAPCFACRKSACVSTKEMKKSVFDTMRTSDFSACIASMTGADAWNVRCDNCTSRSLLCTNGQPDVSITCTTVPGTYAMQCGWWR